MEKEKVTSGKHFKWIAIGLLLNSGNVLTNRFLIEIPEYIAIPLGILALIFMIIGIIAMGREYRNKEIRK